MSTPPIPARPAAVRIDAAAWEALIRAHDRRVFLAVLALGVRADRARDVVQTTWTRLMEKDERGEITKDNVAGLAVAQARFLALDELRRTHSEKRRAEPLPEMLDDLDPEQLLIGRERLERAAAVLAGSSPSVQRLFQLLYAEPPVDYTQAAALVGVSLQRARQVMCELRKKLRVALEEGSS
ncbi:MAG TPA: sigma-70 family RNA polymerase sigma factor [Kofleriaceae bacterium]|nr:sigma-70 family RNA polymerase sigma factor [Kofleriaceae bacterium]